MRFPASVATNEDFERFTERLLAAQIAVGGFLPALLLVTYSWLCPFIECERFEIVRTWRVDGEQWEEVQS